MIFNKVLNRFFKFYFFLKSIMICLKILFKSLGKDLLILDLDNTVVLTAEWLHKNNSTNLELAYEKASLNEPLMRHLETQYSKEQFYYFIVSARTYHNYTLTKKWIFENSENTLPLEFILVNSAKRKLLIYQIFRFKKLVIFDDLTFNHENLPIKKYIKIEKIIRKKKNIVLFDNEFIKQLK